MLSSDDAWTSIWRDGAGGGLGRSGVHTTHHLAFGDGCGRRLRHVGMRGSSRAQMALNTTVHSYVALGCEGGGCAGSGDGQHRCD